MSQYGNPSLYTNNLIGKQFTGLHTQDLVSTGIATDTIIGYADRYTIDLWDNMLTHEAEEVPLLTILQNLGTFPVGQPVVAWNDVYRGNQWFDIHLDDFRLQSVTNGGDTAISNWAASGATVVGGKPYALGASQQVGGKLPIYRLKSYDNTNIVLPSNEASMTANTGFEIANDSTPGIVLNSKTQTSTWLGKGMAWIGFKGDSNIIGNVFNVWNNFRNLALFARYTEAQATDTAAIKQTFTYTEGSAIAPLYLAIESMEVSLSGAEEEHYNVLPRIDKAVIRTLATNGTGDHYIWFLLNFNPGYTNFETDITDGLGADFEEGARLNFIEPYGSISRMMLLGAPSDAAQPIPEGDNFKAGSNINRSGERMINFTQIFASPSYGITGTAQASKLRFLDTFQETRAEYLTWYKRHIEATYLNGMKMESIAGHNTDNFIKGQPVRQLGGFFDRALFPIRFMKATVPANIGSNAHDLRNFIDKLANSLNAFREKGAKDLTFLCSGKFKRRLSTLVDQYMGTTYTVGNPAATVNPAAHMARGGFIQRQMPSEVTFNLQVDLFVTIDGIKVKFIHDKMLDYAPNLKLPNYLGAGYGPRDVLLSIDTANIKRGVLRADQIHGNIQAPGQDAFLEAMRGESTLMVRYPRNHAIVLLDYA